MFAATMSPFLRAYDGALRKLAAIAQPEALYFSRDGFWKIVDKLD
jgi:hypothetical protein